MFLKYFRFVAIALLGCCLAACGEDNDEVKDIPPTPGGGEEVTPPDPEPDPEPAPEPGAGLTFDLSRQVIQSNGEEKCEFIVKYDGAVLENGYIIYDEKDNTVQNNKFFTTKIPGEYKFWAAYNGENTELVTLKAISIPVPELPADPAPERTDFTKRVLLTQFTGTGCGYCPYMMSSMVKALSDKTYADKAVWCVAHTFNRNDPCFLENDRLEQAFGISSYPALNIDFIKSFNYQRGFDESSVRSIIDQAYENPAKAGVSGKAVLIEDNGVQKIALHVAVKAAQDGDYSVGAWLMEDSIYGRQNNQTNIEGDFDTHNNALRVVDSKAGFNNYAGIRLGKMAKGKVAEHVFIMNIDDKWILKNCHMAIFVAQHENNRSSVTNVVPCAIEGDIIYDYVK